MRAVLIATFAIACSSSNTSTSDAAIDGAIDAAEGCATCEAAGTTTVCVAGVVIDSTSGQAVGSMRVRIYDPIAWSSDPNTTPVATVMSDASGSFAAHSVMRPASGLLEIVVDGNGYMSTMQSQQLQPNQNVCITVDVHQ